MAAGAIQGFARPGAVGAPPADTLGALYNQLAAADLGGRYFVINGWGEAWGYAASGEIFTPQALAAWLSEPGHVWIDYCGWPGYYQVQPEGQARLVLGPAGFQTMVKALGFPWLSQATFAIPLGFVQPFGVLPFPRGFPLLGNVAGTAVQHGTFDSGQPLTGNGYAFLVALTPPSGSLWVYATWTGGLGPGGVPPDVVARFVVNVAQGRGASVGIVRTPYPSSGSGSGIGGSGQPPAGGGSGSPAPTPSGPPWGRLAALGALVAAGGVIAVILIPGAPEAVTRWWQREEGSA